MLDGRPSLDRLSHRHRSGPDSDTVVDFLSLALQRQRPVSGLSMGHPPARSRISRDLPGAYRIVTALSAFDRAFSNCRCPALVAALPPHVVIRIDKIS